MNDKHNTVLEDWNNFARSGDPKIFSKIYKSYATTLKFVLYKYVNSMVIAENISQEIWLELFKELPKGKYKNVKNPLAFLNELTKQYAFSHLRQVKLNENFKNPTDVESLMLSEENIRIREAIDNLKGKNYTEILINELNGLSNDEIAKSINRTEKYVRDKKHLAKKELKKILGINPLSAKKELKEPSSIELYFDLGEHSPEEISEIILYIDELYKELGGDEIIMEKPDFIDLADFYEPIDTDPVIA